MRGFDLLGATDALADQLIIVRVKRVDTERLKQRIGGKAGAATSAAMAFVNLAPKAALDIALPIALGQLKTMGIEAEAQVSSAPMPTTRRRAFSEFFPGLAVGVVLGGTGFGIFKLLSKAFGGRS